MDVLIVGAGLTGAVIARMLSDRGKRCLVLERRMHVGGNVHDYIHPSGIRVHTYGPHYFRTSSPLIWSFVRRFSEFRPFEARVLTQINGSCEPWPPSVQQVEKWAGKPWTPGFSGIPSNFEEMALSKMPLECYTAFVKGYTEKQWGVPADTLSASLAKRFSLRSNADTRLTPRARFQGLPVEGYAGFMENMLSGIEVIRGVDYLHHRRDFQDPPLLVFTGPIDAFFDYQFGPLRYRGQQRREIWIPGMDWFQPGIQVNEPHPAVSYVRTLEWKHLLPPEEAARISGTLISRETPYSPDNPDHFEYPFPDAENQRRYKRYRALANALPNTLICGRLGEYRYLDMDQAIARAMRWAKAIG